MAGRLSDNIRREDRAFSLGPVGTSVLHWKPLQSGSLERLIWGEILQIGLCTVEPLLFCIGQSQGKRWEKRVLSTYSSIWLLSLDLASVIFSCLFLSIFFFNSFFSLKAKWKQKGKSVNPIAICTYHIYMYKSIVREWRLTSHRFLWASLTDYSDILQQHRSIFE